MLTLAAGQYICLLLAIAFAAGMLAGLALAWLAKKSEPAPKSDADADYSGAM